MPPPKLPLMARPLEMAARLASRAPRLLLAAGLVLAVVCIGASVKHLGFRTSRLDLLNPSSAYNQRWLRYLDEFGERDDAVVVIEADDRNTAAQIADQLAAEIAGRDDLFESVLYDVDFSPIQAKGLYLLPTESISRIEYALAQLSRDSPSGAFDIASQIEAIDTQLARTSSPYQQAALAAEMTSQLDRLRAVLQGQPPAPAAEEFATLQTTLGELARRGANPGGDRMTFVLLRFAPGDQPFAPASEAIVELRRMIDAARQQHPQASIGLTGMPVLEYDEMQASQHDMTRASALSLLGVACLFVAGFGGVRYPLMTIATLLTAIAWSFGYVVLAVGHLNLLSVSFGVILIGLGIDFGIHYVARYLLLRESIADCRRALAETSASVGPGIVTGGATTAIAFCMAALTDFTGVAELGVIAGGGVILCMIAALTLLPALIFLVDRRRRSFDAPQMLPARFLTWPTSRFPGPVLLVSAMATLLLGGGALRLRYDHNLLNLQADGLESVQVERALLEKTDQSVWFAVSMAHSPAELRARKALFQELDGVERIEEIASLLPDASPQKQLAIQRIRERLALLAGRPSTPAKVDVARLAETIERAAARSGADDLPGRTLRTKIALLSETLQVTPNAEIARRLDAFQQQTAHTIHNQLTMLQSAAGAEPPRLSDLPAPLVDRFVGQSEGRHLMRVYARGNVWDMDALSRFVAQVESVDPEITGHPVQTYYASRQMQQSYIHAGVYAFLAVLIVLMIDFRSLRHALLATLPMALGLAQLFGLLGVFDIALNPANMIVLPLILGIGIDDGVHVVHDFRRQRGPFRLSNSTAMAILLTSTTTMVGFGSLMFAKHQGLRSLGQVITLGVFCCLGTSIVILPALLRWSTCRRGRDAFSDENETDNLHEYQPLSRRPIREAEHA